MNDLSEKIKSIHPEIKDSDFAPSGSIVLQDNSDGTGAFIAEWNHPTITRPTDEQLKGI